MKKQKTQTIERTFGKIPEETVLKVKTDIDVYYVKASKQADEILKGK